MDDHSTPWFRGEPPRQSSLVDNNPRLPPHVAPLPSRARIDRRQPANTRTARTQHTQCNSTIHNLLHPYPSPVCIYTQAAFVRKKSVGQPLWNLPCSVAGHGAAPPLPNACVSNNFTSSSRGFGNETTPTSCDARFVRVVLQCCRPTCRICPTGCSTRPRCANTTRHTLCAPTQRTAALPTVSTSFARRRRTSKRCGNCSVARRLRRFQVINKSASPPQAVPTTPSAEGITTNPLPTRKPTTTIFFHSSI
jgi:ribosomal protein L36